MNIFFKDTAVYAKSKSFCFLSGATTRRFSDITVNGVF